MIAQLQSACCGAVHSAVHPAVEKAEAHKKDAKKHDDNGPFKVKRTVRIHRDKVQCVALSGNQFATASWDCTVKVYNLHEEKVVKSFGKPKCRWTTRDHHHHHGDADQHGGAGAHHWGLSFSSVFGGAHKPDAHHGHGHHEEKKEPSMHGLYSVAFSELPGMDLLACSSSKDEDGSIHVWDVQRGERVLRIGGHTDDVNCVQFHPRQQCLCSGSDDRTAKIFDLQHMSGAELRVLADHDKAVYGTAFLGQTMDYFLATCSFDTFCRVFDMRDQTMVQRLQFHTQEVIGMAFSESKHLLATGGDDGQIALYDIRTWKILQTIDTNKVHDSSEVKRIAIDHSGTMLAAPCVTGDVLVYDISHPQAKQVARLAGHEDCVFGVAWGVENQGTSKAKRMLVSASHDSTSRVWIEKDKDDHHDSHKHAR
jgi:WD40 repeat protein